MPADSKLELVISVDAGKANASIKSVNAGLSSIETTAVSAARGASRGIDGMTASIIKGATAGSLLAEAIKKALGWAKEFAIGSVMLAAENAKAEASLKALATAHGVGAAAAARQVAALEAIGLEYTEAAHAVRRLIIADVELSKAEGLAKLAKDAAAVENVGAGEALEALVMAIESGASRGLRSLGLFIDFQKEVELAQLRLGRALTEVEQKQLRLSAVMREGAKIQGAHAAVARTAEQQLADLGREFKNLREQIGARFQDDLKALVGHLRGLVGWLGENADLLAKFGQAALYVAGILATYALADKILALAKSIAALNLATLNPYALLGVAAVAAGAALYAQWKRGQEQIETRFGDLERRALRMQLLAGKTSLEALRKQGMTDEQIRELVAGPRRLPAEESFQVEGPKISIVHEPDLEALKRAAEIRKRQLEVERLSREALEEARRRSLVGFAREIAEVEAQLRKWTMLVDERGNQQRVALTRQAWENVIRELRLRLANWQKEVQETNRNNLAEYLAAEEEAARRRMELDGRVYAQRLAHNEEIAWRNLDHLGQMLSIEEQRAGLTRDAQLRALEAANAQTLEQKVALEQRKAAIEIEYLERVHAIKQRLFDIETSRMVLEEEANLRRLGYRAEEIEARIAELSAQREDIRRFQQEANDAAIRAVRENAAIRQTEMIRDHNRQIFESLKRQAEGVFDALLTKSQSVWSAIGNALKTAILTAIKEVVSSRVAALLMQLLAGIRLPVGAASARGAGLAAAFAMPTLAAGPISGGWGTPPFVPAGTGWPATLGRWRELLGIGGSIPLAPGVATTWQAATLWQKLSAIGRSPAAALGGGLLALAGLQRGGLSGLAMTTAGGALIGFKYGGPLGAAIGAGIGAVAGIVRLFVKSAEEKAREKIKATYGVDIRDKGILRQIVETAKQAFGGNLEVAIRSPQIRDLVELYAMATGQSTAGLPPAMRPVSLFQRGGALYQQTFPRGAVPSLDRIAAGTPQAAGPIVINITVPGAKEFFEKETVRVVLDNPRSVQASSLAATRANAGRRELVALQLSPGTLTA